MLQPHMSAMFAVVWILECTACGYHAAPFTSSASCLRLCSWHARTATGSLLVQPSNANILLATPTASPSAHAQLHIHTHTRCAAAMTPDPIATREYYLLGALHGADALCGALTSLAVGGARAGQAPLDGRCVARVGKAVLLAAYGHVTGRADGGDDAPATLPPGRTCMAALAARTPSAFALPPLGPGAQHAAPPVVVHGGLWLVDWAQPQGWSLGCLGYTYCTTTVRIQYGHVVAFCTFADTTM